MKRTKENLHFSIFIIICLLLIIWYNTCKLHTSLDNALKQETTWTTVKQKPLKKPSINTKFKNRFTDTETTGCFFLAMKTLGYNTDVDDFYLTLFNEKRTSLKTKHEGQISPDILEQKTLIYLKEYEMEVSQRRITSTNYLFKVCENNYPVIVWINGENNTWVHAIPYLIYSIDENYVYMMNTSKEIKLSPFKFVQYWTGDAIVYGKYW